MSEFEESPTPYRSPRAPLVSAALTRWPGYPFTLNDVITVGYTEEIAGLAGMQDAQRRREKRALTQKALGLMGRNTIQRYVEGDGFYLQEGTIQKVYDTAEAEPLRPRVWRATSMAHPDPPGLQTTDDWLIKWDAHKPVRSSPLIRESVLTARAHACAELFIREANTIFNAHELLARLYPETVDRAMREAPTEPAAHHRIDEIASAMVRSVIYNDTMGPILRDRLAERGLHLLQGLVQRRLEGYSRNRESLARTFFVATATDAPIPSEPVRHGNSMVQWRNLYDDPRQ